MVGEEFVADEHVPIRRFYRVSAVLLVTSLLLGLYVASRFSQKGVAWSTVGIWLLVAVVAGLAVPDQARDALLRRFGARPRRVKWFEHSNRPLFAWQTTDHAFTKAQFVASYGVPVLLQSAVLLAYVLRFPTATPVLGLILPFYLGNLWFALLVLRKPVRSLVRPLERGLRFREPTFRVHINLSLTGPFQREATLAGTGSAPGAGRSGR